MFDYPDQLRENEIVRSPLSTSFIVCCGPVAQLGARFHGMEEVVGSNPTRSTSFLTYAFISMGFLYLLYDRHLPSV